MVSSERTDREGGIAGIGAAGICSAGDPDLVLIPEGYTVRYCKGIRAGAPPDPMQVPGGITPGI